MSGNIMFAYPNRADDATLSGGSYEVDLPITNAQGRELHKVARTTDDEINNTQLIADLGSSAYPIRLLALMAHNISLAGKVRVRGYDTLAVTRASEALFTDEDNIIQSAANNILRQWHYVTANSVRYRTTLLEAQRTNLLLESTPDNDSSPWFNDVDFTLTVATAAIAGTTPYKHTNKNLAIDRFRFQGIGILTAAPETLSLIIENVDAVKTLLGLFDVTSSGWVVQAEFTWATGAIVVTNSALGTNVAVSATSLGTGPSGGALYRLALTGTPNNPGNSRRVSVSPSGITQNGEAVILHHVQHEEAPFASSPIITAGTTVTRVVETLNFPFLPVPQEMTLYFKFVEGGTVAAGKILAAVSGENVAIKFQIGGTGTIYRAIHDNGPAVRIAPLAVGPSIGDLVEIRAVLHSDGDVTIGQSINGAAETTATAGASATLASAWTNLTLYVGGSEVPNAGFTSFIEIKIESGTKTLAEMRAEEDPDLFHFGAYDSELIDAYPEFYPAGSTLWGKDVGGLALQQAEYDAGETYPFVHVMAKAQPFQHWSFEVQDTANADNYIEFGGMFIASVYEPTINMRVGGEIGHETDSTRAVGDGGAAFHDAKRQRRLINAVLPKAAEDEALVQQFALTGILGTDKRFFVVWNSDDTHHMQRRAFPATMRELSLLQFPHANLTDMSIAIVEEL